MRVRHPRRRQVLPPLRVAAYLVGATIATVVVYAYPMLLPAAIAAITTAIFLWERDAAREARRGR